MTTALDLAVVMLGRGLGGIEQAAVDYAESLAGQGHRVTAVIHPRSPLRTEYERLGIRAEGLTTLGEWDVLAARRLRAMLRRDATDAAITIGRRATVVTRRALRALPTVRHIAKSPNYRLEHLVGLDHVVAITADLRRALIELGQPPERITVIPNMVRVPDEGGLRPGRGLPGAPEAVIGAMGRFVAKKGFAPFLRALALLRARGHVFHAVLGGTGEEEAALCASARELDLEAAVEFPGWVQDREAFFRRLDVFCVPSLHEPFGIVVVEGFAHARAMVVTDSEGPREIAAHGQTALVVPRDDPERLADALATLLENPELRVRLATAAYGEARRTYDLPVVGRRISDLVGSVVGRG